MRKKLLYLILVGCMLVATACGSSSSENASIPEPDRSPVEADDELPSFDDSSNSSSDSAPEAEDVITVDCGGVYRDGYYRTAYTLTNTETTYGYRGVTATVTIYEKDGSVLETYDDYFDRLLPNETNAGEMHTDIPKKKLKGTKLEVTVSASSSFVPDGSQLSGSDYKISKLKKRKDYMGTHITGIIENPTSKDSTVDIAAIFYKKKKIVAGEKEIMIDLKAGKQKPFEIVADTPKYDSYKLFPNEVVTTVED